MRAGRVGELGRGDRGLLIGGCGRGSRGFDGLRGRLGRRDLVVRLAATRGGDDQYIYPPGAGGLGIAPFREEYRRPGYSYGPYNYYANSFGLLLDIGGVDRYFDFDPQKDRKTPSSTYANNRTWQQPAPEAEEYGYHSFGVGMDVPDGTVPELFLFDSPPEEE